MNRFASRLGRASVVAGVLAAGVMAFPQLAGAATPATATTYGCAGSEIDTYNVETSVGAVWGVIHLYYDATTGDNCAVNVKTTEGGYGTSSYTTVELDSCSQTSPSSFCSPSSEHYDHGDYTEYAGPVSVHAPGVCIGIIASVDQGDTTALYSTGAVHCG